MVKESNMRSHNPRANRPWTPRPESKPRYPEEPKQPQEEVVWLTTNQDEAWQVLGDYQYTGPGRPVIAYAHHTLRECGSARNMVKPAEELISRIVKGQNLYVIIKPPPLTEYRVEINHLQAAVEAAVKGCSQAIKARILFVFPLHDVAGEVYVEGMNRQGLDTYLGLVLYHMGISSLRLGIVRRDEMVPYSPKWYNSQYRLMENIAALWKGPETHGRGNREEDHTRSPQELRGGLTRAPHGRTPRARGRNRANSRPAPRFPVESSVCFLCHQMGHLSYDCPVHPQGEGARKRQLPTSAVCLEPPDKKGEKEPKGTPEPAIPAGQKVEEIENPAAIFCKAVVKRNPGEMDGVVDLEEITESLSQIGEQSMETDNGGRAFSAQEEAELLRSEDFPGLPLIKTL